LEIQLDRVVLGLPFPLLALLVEFFVDLLLELLLELLFRELRMS
jgi:hypothetical protein